MSKKAHSQAKQDCLKAKRAKKAAQKAQYQAYAEAGQNSKSKRFTLKAKRKTGTARIKTHPTGECGNVGCKKCNPAKLPERVWAKVEQKKK